MDANEIAGLESALVDFLSEFDDCFGRSEPRERLRTYVSGQLSDLARKSVEPMALAAEVPPRTLQRFLELVEWDEQRLRDKLQQTVARDHADPDAIGIIDETGHPKKGTHTAGVKRQWCGNTGKVDNCVVSVHTGYVVGDFQCLLDSDVYLPQEWAQDPGRRQAVHIPDEVTFRTKPQIALNQIRRCLANGIRVASWTFDELYGRDGGFLNGLDALGQTYVAEVPSDFTGWVRSPRVLLRPTAWELKQPGKHRRFPRLAVTAAPPSEVRRLAAKSSVFRSQKWEPLHIKDSQKGPIVWEIKHADFYRQHADGLPGPTHTLIIARNALDHDEMKYFVSNVAVGSDIEKLKWVVHVAFSRFPIEHCFRQAKDELGMDHFEVRGWRSIHRHMYVTQLSHLFCSRMRQALREKNGAVRRTHRRAGSRRRFRLRGGPVPAHAGAADSLSTGLGPDRILPVAQSAGPGEPSEENTRDAGRKRYQDPGLALVPTG
jgi:SRSO17 transposase